MKEASNATGVVGGGELNENGAQEDDENQNHFCSNEEGEGYESAKGNVSVGVNDNENTDEF